MKEDIFAPVVDDTPVSSELSNTVLAIKILIVVGISVDIEITGDGLNS